jgi:predicted ATPase/DNA-binding winged helix-turn-helix (wHTH) protein
VKYRFGEFELDVSAYELRQSGRAVRLAPQPMDVLLMLLNRPRELVTREAIARRLWGPDVHTDADAGIHTAILRIRQVLGDSRELSRFVETVPGRGYRFVEPVQVVDISPAPGNPGVRAVRVVPPRHNLPAELTSFVGRRRELSELPGILAGTRLLCLTGAGGVGKTRLAVRLARDLCGDFRDGVWLVDLAPLSLPELLPQAIATALGLREGRQRSARDVLLDTLRDRDMLLILDTCEHLVPSCADIVQALLTEAPAVRIAATSREPLGVSGEIVYRVPSLLIPELTPSLTTDALAAFEATQLFLERARGLEPAFAPTLQNAAAIVRLCRRLDGIPLAIELAAARIVVLSPEQIERRLEDRFRLLTGGARNAVARQRTLEATVDWSYQLLSPSERELLCRLAVFPATWTLDAAEQICSGDGVEAHDILDLLTRLVDKSLIVAETGLGDRRYRLLETIRQFVRARNAEPDGIARLSASHFEFFFHEFRGVLHRTRHHEQLHWLRRLQVEQDSIRAALDWGLSSPAFADKAVELAGALFWFWSKRGLYEEGRLWLERAVALGGDIPPLVRARALIGLTHMHHFGGRPFDDVIAEAVAIGRQECDAWTTSFAVFMQALAALERNDYGQATALARESERISRSCEEPEQPAGPLMVLANVAVQNGDLPRAQQLYDEAIALERLGGEIWGLSIVLAASARLSLVRGQNEQARGQASEVLGLCRQLEDPRGIAWSFEIFAGVLAAERRSRDASRLWGVSDRLLEGVGGALSPEISWIRNRYMSAVEQSLGVEDFASAREEGKEMLLDDAVALAHGRTVAAREHSTRPQFGQRREYRGSPEGIHDGDAGRTHSGQVSGDDGETAY